VIGGAIFLSGLISYFGEGSSSNVSTRKYRGGGGKQRQIPLINGSKNVEFDALRAIFKVASANSTNKGHRDTGAPFLPTCPQQCCRSGCRPAGEPGAKKRRKRSAA
jgi:hypothetical protein